MMTRQSFRELSRIRLAEARGLLRLKFYDGAYYLCGYSVECGLKACIARRTKRHEFPPTRSYIDDCYTHDLTKLLRAAGLAPQHDVEAKRNAIFRANWAVVKDWSEQARYARKSEQEASELLGAVAHSKHGILRWIRAHW